VQTEKRRLDPEAAGDHIDRLFRAALAMCGSRELAQDLVQETFVKVLSRPRLLRREDDLGYLIKACATPGTATSAPSVSAAPPLHRMMLRRRS
jgi:DNA-directed RNA polymerase specialized sigma24 family protein